ncbi:MAG: gfo/Idh/MocA family oxidoreductase [Bacteroidetes bacterium]|nr:MAG: gfo/Idh/MocA family oxidoreductase [Bacteroidota bacterium]
MELVKWGIIGAGDVTEIKSGPALQKAAGSSLVAVMRRNAAKAEDYARRHGVARWYSRAEDLLADPEVNAVYIATPTSSHKLYTLMAARAGKPVLVEKPMALNSRECEEMIAACEAAGVPLWVAYYRRKLPRFEKMRELILSGAIGSPRAVVIRHFLPEGKLPTQAWKVDPRINGGGLFVDMQAHTLDWLDYTFGPAQGVHGFALNQAGRYEAEDAVSFSLLFSQQVLASGICAYSTSHGEESVTVYGNQGQVSMGFFQASPICLHNSRGKEEFEIADPPHVHQPLVQSIVDQLRGGPPAPSTGHTAMRTTRLIEQILDAGSR